MIDIIKGKDLNTVEKRLRNRNAVKKKRKSKRKHRPY